MQSLALTLSCAVLGGIPPSSVVGKQAPDLVVANWPGKPEVHLRNLRGRYVILALYNTAC